MQSIINTLPANATTSRLINALPTMKSIRNLSMIHSDDNDNDNNNKSKECVIERLRRNDPELIRLDVTASLFSNWTNYDKILFLQAIPQNRTLTALHVSGLDLESVLEPDQITLLVSSSLGGLSETVQDLCVFGGGSTVLNEALTSTLIERLVNLKTLLLFQFPRLPQQTVLASALRQHCSLERVTITLPIGSKAPQQRLAWGCMDVYAMACCQMLKLRVLQIRCSDPSNPSSVYRTKQEDPIISPEAAAVLFRSKTITSLYLENVGLLDDHMDVLAEELPSHNTALQSLDVKDNLLTDDTLYTVAALLPRINHTALVSLDVSGCGPLTRQAGQALAAGMSRNTKVTHLELEGDAARYQDEFDIPVGHSQDDWAQQIYYHLRLNRAQAPAVLLANDKEDSTTKRTSGAGTTNSSTTATTDIKHSRRQFVNALNSVSDQIDCLFYLVRTYPGHCQGAHHCPKVHMDGESATPAQRALMSSSSSSS